MTNTGRFFNQGSQKGDGVRDEDFEGRVYRRLLFAYHYVLVPNIVTPGNV